MRPKKYINKRQLNLTIENDLIENVKKICFKKGITMTDYINKSFTRFVKSNEKLLKKK